LKSDYRYSKDIVYNNFVWPDATDEQKAMIEKLAQGILDARAELLKAHRELDKAAMKLYGFGKDAGEAEVLAGLMWRHGGINYKKM